jgi:hypothetical protein
MSTKKQPTLKALIKAGKYDWVNPDITTKNFPPNKNTAPAEDIEIIDLNMSLTTEHIIKELDGLGLRPATIHELLKFGAKTPDEQRKYPIVSLGSSWVNQFRLRNVPYLRCVGDDRMLRLCWDNPSNKWNGDCRFAAVLKSKTVKKKTLINSSKRKAK